MRISREQLQDKLIGGIFQEPEKLYAVSFQPEDFIDEERQQIWGAILELHKSNEEINVLSVHEKTGLPLALLWEYDKQGVPSSTDYIIKRLQDTVYREQLLAKLKTSAEKVVAGKDLSEVIGDLMDLPTFSGSDDVNTEGLIIEGFRGVEDMQASQHRWACGVDTLFPRLNANIGGYYGARIVVVSGRPGAGKSIYGLSVAATAASRGQPAGFVTLEMPLSEQGLRLIARRSNQSTNDIRSLSPERLQVFKENVLGKMKDWPLYLTEVTKLEDIISQLMKWKYEKGIQVAVIDYCQLIETNIRVRQEELSKVTRTLKKIANKLELPIIVIAQMNRGIEGETRRPRLSDLRESGAIENDADLVMFLYEGEEERFAYIAKNRIGHLDEFPIYLEGEHFKIGERND